MKRFFDIAAICALVLVCLTSCAGADTTFVAVPLCAHAPVIDGKIDAGEWGRAACIGGFRETSSGYQASEQTLVYLTYDAQKLYIAYRCYQPNSPKAELTKRDDTYWLEDSVELFLQTDLNQSTHYQFIGNGKGGFWDSIGMNSKWNGNFTYAASVSNSYNTIGAASENLYWEGELSIAWHDLGIDTPKEGFTMGFAAVRDHQKSAPPYRSSWSDIGQFPHDAKGYGRIILAGDSPAAQVQAIGDGAKETATAKLRVVNPGASPVKIGGHLQLTSGGQVKYTCPIASEIAPGSSADIAPSQAVESGFYDVELLVNDGSKTLLLAPYHIFCGKLIEASLDKDTRKVTMHVNLSGVSGVDGVRVITTISSGEREHLGLLKTMNSREPSSTLYLDLSKLPRGEYKLKCMLLRGFIMMTEYMENLRI